MNEIETVEPEVLDDTSKIDTYTRNDYLKSTLPYDYIWGFHSDRFKFAQIKELVAIRAKEVGVSGFNSKFKEYINQYHPEIKPVYANFTEFSGQPMELASGKYVCREDVCFEDNHGNVQEVCNHPIMPVKRLVNIDDNTEKLIIKYRKGFAWREIVADKEMLASASKITQLAKYGIAVNSENAKYLVKYLTDIESLNFDDIEEKKSVGRLGWVKDHEFSPYVGNLVFDGDESFRGIFKSVRHVGDYSIWHKTMLNIRIERNPCARIMLAASFASALVEPCDCLPFFVHLWGGTESGKTVALMLAASVWASPLMGDYIRTFNSTAVAQELTAGFVNSLPLCYDELQIVKNQNSFDELIYKLCEGVGRDRGKKSGGVQKLLTWRNAVLTTGEFPISNAASGAGAINRVVEIDCKDIRIFSDPIDVVSKLKKNYGFAGLLFIEWLLQDDHMDEARQLRVDYQRKLSEFNDVTDKQAMSASLILAADDIIEKLLFHDGIRLSVDEIKPFLVTKKDVDQNKRCYEFLNDYVAVNYARFNYDSEANYIGEIWGDARSDVIYFIKSKFDRILQENGYNSRAFLSWAAKNELIQHKKNRYTVMKRLPHITSACNCVALLRVDESEEATSDLPF